MTAHESFSEEPYLSPEVEMEGFRLFDELLAKIATSEKSVTWQGKIHRTNFILEEKYPDADKETVQYSTAVFYNYDKNITAVIDSELTDVDGDAKQAILVEFFRGAPFDLRYSQSRDTQFIERPCESSEEDTILISVPLQSAYAVWDIDSHSYGSIDYNTHSETKLDAVQVEDFTSMRIWLSGANIPLDIV